MGINNFSSRSRDEGEKDSTSAGLLNGAVRVRLYKLWVNTCALVSYSAKENQENYTMPMRVRGKGHTE